MRHAKYGGFCDTWLLVNQEFDLFWVDVEPAADNHIFFAADDRQIAAGIYDTLVPSIEQPPPVKSSAVFSGSFQ